MRTARPQMRSFVFPLVATLAAGAASCQPDRVSAEDRVKVTGGVIEGTTGKGGIRVFKGIPFAAPPVGQLRWRAPQPVKPWTGVRKADAFGPAPMQDANLARWVEGAKTISEDCLYLNVWTPAQSPGERLPVMVWIYGGAFTIGATSTPGYDGTRLAQKGVVVVSIAYRLGPFGFLAHPQLSAESGKGSGSYGLQDQIAALRWVKSNIAQFGGAPSRVTIFGESAGAISVSILMGAPGARGLFQRAISQSGVLMAPVKQGNEATAISALSLKEAEKRGVAFLARLGAKNIGAARALGAERILQAGGGINEAVVDGEVVLGDHYALFEAGRFADVPLLAGWNGDDGGMFAPKAVTPQSFVDQARTGFGPSAEAILSVYPHATDAQARKSVKGLVRDLAFAWPAWARARLLTRHGKSPAFLYYFDYTPNNAPDGPGHAAEIPYVFGNLGGWFGGPKLAERAISEKMMSYWVNFAKTGNPNGAGLPAWPSFNEKAMRVMYFDGSPGMRPVPNLKGLEALDAYFAWRREQARRKS